MTKRGALLMLDSSMLLFFVVLMSWRMTGVPLHEWLGLTLTVLILGHLLVHWGWVEGRVASVRRSRNGRVGGLLLNSAVFVAMGATIISGFVVSKVVLPNHLTPERYLRWHGLHESGATLTVLLLGLHLAYNWDRLRSAFRRAGARPRTRWLSDFSLALVLRRAIWVIFTAAVLTVGVWASATLLPGQSQVMFVHADGRRELAPPPPEITRLRPDQLEAQPGLGIPKVAGSLALIAVVAVIGRGLLMFGRARRRVYRSATIGSTRIARRAGK